MEAGPRLAFSWQTALTTGIMLLVMYGDEIIDWTKSLFGAKNGVDALTKAMQEKNEVEKEAHAISIRTRTELDNTLREIKDFTGTKEQEKAKVDELNQNTVMRSVLIRPCPNGMMCLFRKGMPM